MKEIVFWLLPIINIISAFQVLKHYLSINSNKLSIFLIFVLPVLIINFFTFLLFHSHFFSVIFLNLIFLLTLNQIRLSLLEKTRPFKLLFVPFLIAVIFVLFYYQVSYLKFIDDSRMVTYHLPKSAFEIKIDTITNDYVLSKQGRTISFSGDLSSKSLIIFATLNIILPFIVNYISSIFFEITRENND
jgi:hypothetical protein